MTALPTLHGNAKGSDGAPVASAHPDLDPHLSRRSKPRRRGSAIVAVLTVATAMLTAIPEAAAEDYRYDNRLLRISRLSIDDGTAGGANGDGDGFAECGETIVLSVELTISDYYPHLSLYTPTMRIDPRSRVASLVGNDTSLLPSISWNGPPVTAPDRFTIQIDETVAPGEAIYLVVDVIPSDGSTIFRRHRHIPVSCGIVGGDAINPPQITMPMYGIPSYSNNWLADRPELIHEGVDIFETQMTPVLAAADGYVSTVLWTNDLAHVGPTLCCSVSIRHDDGWESWYSHMNNDTPGYDNDIADLDPLDWELGYVPGLKVGDRVLAGQIIGWVGDSGNAKYTPHHLHFELHDPAGNPVNPYAPLLRALRPSDPYSCPTSNGICRIAGSNRYGTAALTSEKANPAGADLVFVAVGTNYPDAIAAGPAASHLGAPVLLTARTALPPSTYNELRRLDPATVVILGGEGAVSSAVAAEIRGALPGASLVRYGGATRYETAAAISREVFPQGGGGTVYVATGENHPDALLTTAAAARDDSPILLVRSDHIPSATAAELTRLGPDRIVIVGGPDAVSDAMLSHLEAFAPSIERWSAPNRYVLSAMIAQTELATAGTVYIAVGTRFPDALSAANLIAAESGPLLLVAPDHLPDVIAAELERRAPDEIVVLGGFGAVPLRVYAAMMRFAA